jgi:hypothetical protein
VEEEIAGVADLAIEVFVEEETEHVVGNAPSSLAM